MIIITNAFIHRTSLQDLTFVYITCYTLCTVFIQYFVSVNFDVVERRD